MRACKSHTHTTTIFISLIFSRSAACCEVNSWPFKAVCRWIFASWKIILFGKAFHCYVFVFVRLYSRSWLWSECMKLLYILDEMNSNRTQGFYFLRNRIFRQEFPFSSVCSVRSVLNSMPYVFIKMCTTL